MDFVVNLFVFIIFFFFISVLLVHINFKRIIAYKNNLNLENLPSEQLRNINRLVKMINILAGLVDEKSIYPPEVGNKPYIDV